MLLKCKNVGYWRKTNRRKSLHSPRLHLPICVCSIHEKIVACLQGMKKNVEKELLESKIAIRVLQPKFLKYSIRSVAF